MGQKRRDYNEVRERGNQEFRPPDALEGRGSGAVCTRSAPRNMRRSYSFVAVFATGPRLRKTRIAPSRSASAV
jgi:hypothetical protein